MLRGLVLYAIVLAGCYSPPSPCGVTCATSNECPGEAACVNGLCVGGDECTGAAIREISIGSRHVCALDRDGALYCWGANHNGELGFPSSQLVVATPTRVGADTWDVLSVGTESACAMRAGQISCWGRNHTRQADPSTDDLFVAQPTPLAFPAGAPLAFQRLAVGHRHACAIGDGQLWCWGNAREVVGGGPALEAPVRIGTLADWTQISVGFDHACGISGTLGLACWGDNNLGECGLDAAAMNPVLEPTSVSLPAELAGTVPTVIEAGDDASCLITGGQLWCWGTNDNLLLGEMVQNTHVPQRIGADADWQMIRAGGTTQCGVRGGMATCWGRTSFGGIGGGSWVEASAYADASTLGPARVVDVMVGSSSPLGNDEIGCLIDGDTARCWGDNSSGTLATGTPSRQLSPVAVAPPSPDRIWRHVAAGVHHVCATTDNRELYCWGLDNKGQLAAGRGTGTTERRCTQPPCSAARPVRGPDDAQDADELSLGQDWTCARDGGVIRCWGRDETNFLGGTPATNGIATVAQLDNANWKRLTGGHRGSCGVTVDDLVACWGDVGNVEANVALGGEFPGLGDIRFGADARCFSRADGKRVCWGSDADGRLGNGAAGDSPDPTVITVGSDVRSVQQGTNHGCAVTTLNSIECWGANYQGQAGVDPAAGGAIETPAVVNNVAGQAIGDCTAVSAFQEHTCAICDGAALCWGGFSAFGLTGRGPNSADPGHRAARVDLDGEHVFVEISTHAGGACAIDDDGALFCWGDSPFGENGDGGAGSPVPVEITIPMR